MTRQQTSPRQRGAPPLATRRGKDPRTARRARPRRPLRRLALGVLLALCGIAAAVLAYALLVVAPAMAPLSATAPARVRSLLAAHHGTYLSAAQLGYWLPRATIAIEDRRFYTHGVVDLQATGRALLFDVRGGRPLQGGATIDMQLAERLLAPDSSDPLTYTLRVLLLATQLDHAYGKQGVLTLYLNDIYYGSGAYGAGAAARIFFHRTPAQLTSAQAAYLAGLPNAPSIYGDHPRSAATRARWRLVLAAMARAQDLTPSEEEGLLAQGPPLP